MKQDIDVLRSIVYKEKQQHTHTYQKEIDSIQIV